jgi:hypothetical protein
MPPSCAPIFTKSAFQVEPKEEVVEPQQEKTQEVETQTKNRSLCMGQ